LEDIAALEEEEAERDAIVTEINRMIQENGKSELILSAYIPSEQIKMIKESIQFNEDVGSWDLPCIAYTGNHVDHVISNGPPPRYHVRKRQGHTPIINTPLFR